VQLPADPFPITVRDFDPICAFLFIREFPKN